MLAVPSPGIAWTEGGAAGVADCAETTKVRGVGNAAPVSAAVLPAPSTRSISLSAQAASRLAAGQDALREIAMAKLFSSEVFVRAAPTGMQVLGAYGTSMEFDMQRWFRDSRGATVAAGTSQMQRNLIANLMGLKGVNRR